jgi:hypothetical protein
MGSRSEMQRNRIALRPENAAIAGMPSRTHPYRLALPRAWLLGLFICGTLLGQPRPTTYEDALTAARNFTANGAHVAAGEAFQSAFSLAPDDEARRWCALWELQSRHEAFKHSYDGRASLFPQLEILLAPYQAARQPPDRFWAEASLLSTQLARYLPGRPPSALSQLTSATEKWARLAQSDADFETLEKLIHGLVAALPRQMSDHTESQRALDLLQRLAEHYPAGPAQARIRAAYATALEFALGRAERESVARAYDDVAAAATTPPVRATAQVNAAWWRHLARDRDGELPERPWSANDYTRTLDQIETALVHFDPVSPPAASERFRALKKLREELTRPQIRLTAPSALSPDSTFGVDVQAQHLHHVGLRIIALDGNDFLSLQTTSDRTKVDLTPYLNRTAVAAWAVAANTAPQAQGRVALRTAWNRGLKSGYYVLLAHDPDKTGVRPVFAPFLVTRIQAIGFRSGTADLEIHGFDANTLEPVKSLKTVVWMDGSPSLAASGTGGIVRIELPGFTKSDVQFHAIGISGDDQPFYLSFHEGARGNKPLQAHHQFHLFSDRSLYQPGETARWRLVGRKQSIDGLTVPAQASIQVQASTRDGKPLGTWDLTLNSRGTAGGELAIPESVGATDVTFSIASRDEGHRFRDQVEAFRIDHFRAPEATLVMEPDLSILRSPHASSRLPVTVRARYLSGEPLVKATLSVQVELFENRPDSHWGHADDESQFGRMAAKHHTFDLSTDVHGNSTFHVPLPKPLPDHLNVRLKASLGTAGTMARSTRTFEIPRSGFNAQLTHGDLVSVPQTHSYPKDDVELRQRIHHVVPTGKASSWTVTTRDGLALPVRASGIITLQKHVWDEIWRGPDGTLLQGDALHQRRAAVGTWPPQSSTLFEAWEQIRAEEVATTLAMIDVTTDEAGIARVAFPALTPGRYSITFDTPASPNPRPLAAIEFIVAAPGERLPIRPNATPLVMPLTAGLRPGEPIRALVVIPQAPRRVWLRLATPWSAESRMEAFTDTVQVVTFPWSSASASGVKIEASVLENDDGRIGTSALLQLETDVHHLDLKLEATPRVAAPGSSGRLRIAATAGPEGTRWPAEFAVSVSDAAIDALAPTQSRSLIRTLNPALGIARARRFASPAPQFLGALQPELPESSFVVLSRELSALLRGVIVSTDHDGSYGATFLASPVSQPPADNVLLAHDPRVRSRFTYTAAWFPAIESDDKGEATVDFTYPDNLTTWRITAEAIGDGNRFGTANTETRTTMPLQSRLRLPRAVVAGDTLGALAAVVSTDTEAREATAALRMDEADAGRLERVSPEKMTLQVPARSEAVTGWSLRATQAGDATLTLTARTAVASDGMQLTLPILEDGFLQPTGASGRAGDQPLTLTLDLPSPLDPARTSVEVQLAPGILTSVMGALPYLIDYPYGCVEQTMSRFLPAVVARSWLRELGSDANVIDQVIRAAPRPTVSKTSEPPPTLEAVVQRSLSMLAAAANARGGFAWWPGGEPDDFMSSYVLRGLSAARRAGVSLPADLESETLKFVLSSLPGKRWQGEDSLNAVWLLSAALSTELLKDESLLRAKEAYARIHPLSDQLPPVGIALLLQCAHHLARSTDIPILVKSLESSVQRHSSGSLGETATWGTVDGYAPHLSGLIESTALCLEALLLVDPRHPLIDPAAAALLLNRQSNRWSNTRDTSHAALALLSYARNRGETASKAAFHFALNGRSLDTLTLTPASQFAPHTLRIPASALQSGRNTLEVKRLKGQTSGYVTVTAQSWARATDVKPLGDFLRASRDYVRFTERSTLLGRSTPASELLPASGAAIGQGNVLECRVRLEVPQDVDYVMVSCPKPGGCEPINPLSGWDATLVEITPPEASPSSWRRHGLSRSVYREEHPDRSVFFLHHLPAGTWELRYTLRATYAGDYRALPVVAQAMYAPVVSANTDARRLAIQPVAGEQP